MKYEDFYSELKLNSEQIQKILCLLNQYKDQYTEICLRSAIGCEKSPMDYAVELQKGKYKTDRDAFSKKFLDFLSKEQEPASKLTYVEVGVQLDKSTRDKLNEVLKKKQKRKFLNLEINSMLDIDTGYDPFQDTLSEAIEQTATSIRWEFFVETMKVVPVKALKIKRILNQGKDQFTGILLHKSIDSDESPIEYAANLKLSAVHSDEGAFKKDFTAYLIERQDADTQLPYLEAGRKIEVSMWKEILEVLSDDERKNLETIDLGNLLYIDTGYDPLGNTIAEHVQNLRIKSISEKKGQKYKGYFCPLPFEYITVCDNGDVYLCSACKMNASVGNLRNSSLKELWNSDISSEVRRAIFDGSYRYCNESECEYLQDRKLRRNEEFTNIFYRNIISQKLTIVESSPRIIEIAYDKSCNLSCPYCRQGYTICTGDELKRLSAIHNKVFTSDLSGVERLMIAGCGDPLASKLFKNFLSNLDRKHFSGLKIKLQTNGLLLNKEMWNSISKSHYAIDWISISIDAATPKTYKINRGGSFGKLLKNIEFVSNLRKNNFIETFNINFVVQANNFREMKQFIKLGEQYGCDYIVFQRIMNLGIDFGLYSDEKYREVAIHLKSHPEHEEFLAVLKNQDFLDPRVGLFKLLEFFPEEIRRKKDVDSIIQYYPKKEQNRFYR